MIMIIMIPCFIINDTLFKTDDDNDHDDDYNDDDYNDDDDNDDDDDDTFH